MFKKIIISIVIFFGIITFAQSETSWIKKKDKTKKVEKVEKKSNSWINKKKVKVKENKKEYKVEEKKITKEIKSWIKKKSKDKYYKKINDLPDGGIYFTANNEGNNVFIHGFVLPDTTSEMVDNKFYKTSKGFGYLDDGKTTCKIGSTIIDINLGVVTARVSGECTNGIKFAGVSSQMNGNGFGTAGTKDGERFNFDFGIDKSKIALIHDKNKSETLIVERQLPTPKKQKILLKPNGKYYALLIGNSIYDDKGWDQLVSPANDIGEIEKVLDKSYKFEEIIVVKSGTKKEIFSAFKKLSKLTTTNDYVFIYYSGHGETRAEQAYWIPKDGSAEWGNGDWININELNIFLTEIKAHHLAVMVDSCYVGGKFKGTNILDVREDSGRKLWNDNLIDDLNLRARSVLASGSTGRVSDTASNSKHSKFALSFLNLLKFADREAVPINLISVAMNVRNAFTGDFNQKPFYYNPDTWAHGGGDFIFIPKKNYK